MKYRKQIAAVALTFFLGIHDGYIAMWKDGSSYPVEVFPYKSETLPISDQERLKNGIYIKDRLQLAQLLEDYLS